MAGVPQSPAGGLSSSHRLALAPSFAGRGLPRSRRGQASAHRHFPSFRLHHVFLVPLAKASHGQVRVRRWRNRPPPVGGRGCKTTLPGCRAQSEEFVVTFTVYPRWPARDQLVTVLALGDPGAQLVRLDAVVHSGAILKV